MRSRADTISAEGIRRLVLVFAVAAALWTLLIAAGLALL